MIRVRPMTYGDLDAVAAIERSVYPFPWTRGNFADSLTAGHDAWIFDASGEAPGSPHEAAVRRAPPDAETPASAIAGYAVAMWIPEEVHLLNLSVVAHRQGQGFGHAMLDWLMNEAAARGARGMMLEVRPSNERANALYRSAGFEQIGVRRRYYPAEVGREDARVLFRNLRDE